MASTQSTQPLLDDSLVASRRPWHYHEQAVNALGFGRKTWYLRPPPTSTHSVEPPRTWRRAPLDAIVCEQRAGDILYVPAGWGHAVVNAEPSVGAAVEFVDAFMVHHQNVYLVPLSRYV